MKILNVLVPIVLALFLTNCSIDVSIDDITANDFIKSTILASSRGVGDGQSTATLVVLLKNSDDTLVTNHKPSFIFVDNSGSAITGNGITYSDCDTSNAQGISTCSVRSVYSGPRRLSFNNIQIELIGEVYFDPPERNGTFLQIVNSAQINQTAGGYSVTSHTGSPFAGLEQQAGGYTIFTNTTGSITPVE